MMQTLKYELLLYLGRENLLVVAVSGETTYNLLASLTGFHIPKLEGKSTGDWNQRNCSINSWMRYFLSELLLQIHFPFLVIIVVSNKISPIDIR